MLTFEDKLEAARNDGKYEGRLEEREEIILKAYNKYIQDYPSTPSFDEFVSIYGFMIKDEFVDYAKGLFKFNNLD